MIQRILSIVVSIPSPKVIAPFLEALIIAQNRFLVFRHLSLFWMDASDSSDGLVMRIVRCLNLCNVLLHSFASYSVSVFQFILPSILINLVHSSMSLGLLWQSSNRYPSDSRDCQWRLSVRVTVRGIGCQWWLSVRVTVRGTWQSLAMTVT